MASLPAGHTDQRRRPGQSPKLCADTVSDRVFVFWQAGSFVKHGTPECPTLRRTAPERVTRVEADRPPLGYDACRICCRLPPQGSAPGLRWPA